MTRNVGFVLLSLTSFLGACGSPTGESGLSLPSISLAEYEADLTTVSARQANHGYPRLAIDTQVSYYGDTADGYLGQELFSRLHWFDYAIVDGNVTVAQNSPNFLWFLGVTGSIRALNPNFVSVAYFSLADFLGNASSICYQPLLTYYAFGSTFNQSNCSDYNTSDDFDQNSLLYHDVSGNFIKLYNFGGGVYSYIVDPNKLGLQQRYVGTVNSQIVNSHLVDGIYHDWGGFSEIPSQGYTNTVSLLNNGVNNLSNINNLNDPVNLDWQAGLSAVYALGKATYPSDFILTGNSGWGTTPVMYTNALQGTQLEDFNDSVASAGWQEAMYTYGTWAMNGQTPNFSFIQSDIVFGGSSLDSNHLLYDLMVSSGNNWITSAELQQMRFGLTSALMFDGYFATSNTNASTNGGYSAIYWLDEYAVDANGNAVVPIDQSASAARAEKGWLGSPQGAAYNVSNTAQSLWSVLSTGLSNNSNTSVWRRDFTNGTVIVNPTSSTQSINLGGSFKKINGIVDPTVNNGATGITSVSLISQSGVILRN